MTKKHTPFLVVLFLVVITSCNRNPTREVLCKKTISVLHPVTIKNRGSVGATFTLKWNGSFTNFDSILTDISQLPDDYLNEPLERKSWRFVIKHMDFFRNPIQSSEIHHPLVLINSLGYGQCDDLATMLYFIWKKQGFNARIWGLGKHVVPEVFSNGKWQMYDPAFQVYYFNKSGIPASVQELTANNQLILNPIKSIAINEKNNLDTKIMDSLRYSMSVCKHYLSNKDHFENKTYYNTVDVGEFIIQIPPGCSITTPVYKPTIMIQSDWLSKSRNNHYYLKLNVPANSHGTIKIPLILTAVEGEIVLSSNAGKKRIYTFLGSKSNALEIIDTALDIVGTNKTTQLYYKLPEKFNKSIPITIGFTSNQLLTLFINQPIN